MPLETVACRASAAFKARLVIQALREKLVQQFKEQLEKPAQEECKEQLDPKARKETMVFKEQLE